MSGSRLPVPFVEGEPEGIGEGKEQHTWPVRRRTGATDNNLNILYDPDSNHVLRERAGTGMGAYRKDYVLDVVRDRVLGVVGSGSMSGGIAANTTYWYQNFRGDVRAVGNGLNTDTRSYLPTGVAVAGSADAVDFPDVRYGFQGKEVQTTGLADFENRFYAAHQGRFGSRDPLEVKIGQEWIETSAFDVEDILSIRRKFSYKLIGSDPSGLYTVSDTCRGWPKDTIRSAMWDAVKTAVNSASLCIWNDGDKLRNKMKSRYDSTLISCTNDVCNSGKKDCCASASSPGDRINLRWFNKSDCNYLTMLLLHELTHNAGGDECVAEGCERSCGDAIGRSYTSEKFINFFTGQRYQCKCRLPRTTFVVK